MGIPLVNKVRYTNQSYRFLKADEHEGRSIPDDYCPTRHGYGSVFGGWNPDNAFTWFEVEPDEAMYDVMITHIRSYGAIGADLATGKERMIFDMSSAGFKSSLKYHNIAQGDVVRGLEPIRVNSPLKDHLVSDNLLASTDPNDLIGIVDACSNQDRDWLRLACHKMWKNSRTFDQKLKDYIKHLLIRFAAFSESDSSLRDDMVQSSTSSTRSLTMLGCMCLTLYGCLNTTAPLSGGRFIISVSSVLMTMSAKEKEQLSL
jgi:hypothetical protein